MTDEMELTLRLGFEKMTWTLEKMTDGSGGEFILFDEEGQPRLILTAEELMELQGATA